MHDPLANLNLLLERAGTERDAALLALRQAEASLAAATQQAIQLGTYREQFRERWGARFRAGGAAATLVQVHQGFGQRLDQAIGMQQSQLVQARSRLDTARAAVIERERRVALVRKLIERRTQDAQRAADRREQRATDEAAQRARNALHPH